MLEISQTFGFDAAHHLNAGAPENRRMHGHSFQAGADGFLRDFGEVDAVLKAIRENLDHHLLNEVEGLGTPTLENIARYIHDHAKAKLPEVVRVTVRRPSYGQTCTYGA